MARAGMATLIDAVEKLLNDSSNATWSADQVQTGLDKNRTDWRQAEMGTVAKYTSTGTSYLEWYLGPSLQDRVGAWEDLPILYGASYSTATPTTYDYVTGLFTFAASQSPPLYISGQTYDLYGAAADLLYDKLASVAPNYDFSAAGQSFSASQEFTMWQSLYNAYQRQRKQLKTARFVRTDSNTAIMPSTPYPPYLPYRRVY